MKWRQHQPVSDMVKEVAATVNDTHHHAIASTFGKYDESPLESLWQLQVSMLTEISAAKRQLEMAMDLLRATLVDRTEETPVTEAILAFLQDHYDGADEAFEHLSCWCPQYEYTLHSGTIPCKKTPGGLSAQCADCDGCKACRAVWEGDLVEKEDADGNRVYERRVSGNQDGQLRRRPLGTTETSGIREDTPRGILDETGRRDQSEIYRRGTPDNVFDPRPGG